MTYEAERAPTTERAPTPERVQSPAREQTPVHAETSETVQSPGRAETSETVQSPGRAETSERVPAPERAEHLERLEGPEYLEHFERDEDHESRDESPSRQLIPQDECDKLTLRLQQSLGGFVDGPRHAVEEAAAILEDTADRITTALTERRQALRADWDSGKERRPVEADTEELRVALRAYREVTERLLRI
ncbi:hypothetical protein ACFYRC_09500 [Streptomyces sp. NPDC005279]|uniref:hypothetical protein n=1 Tax=Streptomyces sp. NPDC005279 TaxID=3364712 RepID=UPI00368A7F3D